MSQKRLSMRKLKEIARLKFDAGRTYDEIASAVGVARSTVQTAVRRLCSAGVGWPWPADCDEAALEARLYPVKPGPKPGVALPDFNAMRGELSRKGMTRRLLWLEYRERESSGLEYSQFCALYRRWRKTQDVVLRFEHAAGDKLFVDYAGLTMPVIEAATGEVRQAQIYVAALGHSGYTYAEPTWSQGLEDWLSSHVRTFEYLGGVPAAVVPDNLKSGVSRAHRYAPDVNPAYQDLAVHYGLSVLPARASMPRDKAMVESAVQVVERWILAPLRDRQFFTLAGLANAMKPLLEALNAAPFQKREDSRRIVFEQRERAALKPLPTRAYTYATWKKAKVHLDYHVEHERRYYSVPHALVGKTVDLRVAARTVEVFWQGRQVAAHPKGTHKGQFMTDAAHRPPAHQAVIELNHERILRRAEAIGEATAGVIRAQASRRTHRDETLRSSLGILRLASDFSAEQLEHACARALELKSVSYRAIVTLLKSPPAAAASPPPVIEHENVRGAAYFGETGPC